MPATEAAICGYWEDGKPWAPSREAVRAALPWFYREAFDRAGNFWFGDNPGEEQPLTAHCALYSSKGKYLNTIYATVVRG